MDARDAHRAHARRMPDDTGFGAKAGHASQRQGELRAGFVSQPICGRKYVAKIHAKVIGVSNVPDERFLRASFNVGSPRPARYASQIRPELPCAHSSHALFEQLAQTGYIGNKAVADYLRKRTGSNSRLLIKPTGGRVEEFGGGPVSRFQKLRGETINIGLPIGFRRAMLRHRVGQ
jgi:hypothetical protein